MNSTDQKINLFASLCQIINRDHLKRYSWSRPFHHIKTYTTLDSTSYTNMIILLCIYLLVYFNIVFKGLSGLLVCLYSGI